jgi:hypothetical protein
MALPNALDLTVNLKLSHFAVPSCVLLSNRFAGAAGADCASMHIWQRIDLFV